MKDRVKSIQDLSIYPEWFQEVIKWMDTYNLSCHQAAKKLKMPRLTLNGYINHPEKIPNPEIFTGALNQLPHTEKILLKYIKNGKNGKH